jgi:hypothetical protein
MKLILEVKLEDGSFYYRTVSNGSPTCPWQWGGNSHEDAVAQARSRFSFGEVVAV